MVNLVGINGGLAWFTLLWPLPAVVDHYDPTYALDDPQNFDRVVTDPAHPLYARTTGSETIFQSQGKNPFVTAFARVQQQHSYLPQVLDISSSPYSILSIGVLAQRKSLAPRVPWVSITELSTGIEVPGVDPAVTVNSLSGAITAVATRARLASPASLTPDDATVAAWAGASPEANQTELARGMLFAGKAFEQGLVGTIMLPALADDPHDVFATPGAATTNGATLVHILDSFYEELGKSNEPSCLHNGQPISLADNTILLVTGDTPKDPFVAAGWPDTSPGGANVVYLRSNGFVVPGWFGDMQYPDKRVNFDPTTGALSPDTTLIASTNAALGGILYAIARGDTSGLEAPSLTTYSGVVGSPTP